MNKIIISIVAGVVVLAAMAGLLTMAKPDKVDAPQTTNTPASTTQSDTNKENDASTTTQTTNQTSQAKVEIKDFAYTPASITVKKGTTVTWTNKDTMRHDVTPDNESDAFKGSELLGKDETYSFTFNTAGTYTYHCSPHPYMKATVTVTE